MPAFVVAVFCAGAPVLVAILAASGVPFAQSPFDLFTIAYATFFAAIAYGLWKCSRAAANAGLVLYVFEWIEWIYGGPAGPKNPLIALQVSYALVFTLAFIGGVRGTFAYRKLMAMRGVGSE